MLKSVPALAESLSAEARTAIEAVWAVRGSISMAPPKAAEAAAWRAQLNGAFRPPAEVLASYQTESNSTERAGVSVIEVRPKAAAPSPQAVLYFHGGGYTIGEPNDGLAHGLARSTGLTVYSSEYRKAPEHVFPAAQDDALAVYSDLSVRLGAQNLVVAGCSAGGGLALSMLLRARDAGLALPAAFLGISPWVSLAKTGDSILFTSPQLEPLGSYDQAGLGQAARAYAGKLLLEDPRLSPLYADFSRGFCPVLLTTGTRDWFLSSSAELARKLKCANVQVELSVWEGLGHAFEVLPIPEAFEAHGYMATFIRQALAASTSTRVQTTQEG